MPSDTQMREILDGVPTEPLRRLLPELFESVRRAGWASQFKIHLPTGQHRGDYYTVVLDGRDYFHSTQIECPGCLKATEANEVVHYRHTVVAATLVRAGSHRVLPLDVEEVRKRRWPDQTGRRDQCREAVDRAVSPGASADVGHRQWR